MTTQLFLNSLFLLHSCTNLHVILFGYTVECSIKINSIMNNSITVQEFSRTPENSQGQQNVFQGSRT